MISNASAVSLGAPAEGPGPLAPYAALATLFAALLATAARANGRHRVSLPDVVTIGLASHALGQIVAHEKIAIFLRAPFADGPAAVHPRGEGLRRAVGELVTCPKCNELWIGLVLAVGLSRAPRETRFASAVLATRGVSGILRATIARLRQDEKA